MDKRVLNWLLNNKGRVFVSPRDEAYGSHTKDFEISSIKQDRVYVKFNGNKYVALPLVFQMFDRVLDYLAANKTRAVRLGAKFAPPYDNETLESVIWKKPHPVRTVPYKASPHVCDILCLAGLIEYVSTTNPMTGRRVQAVKLRA
jgi:hypothetical protein